jgi:hypothetical protein
MYTVVPYKYYLFATKLFSWLPDFRIVNSFIETWPHLVQRKVAADLTSVTTKISVQKVTLVFLNPQCHPLHRIFLSIKFSFSLFKYR